MAIFHFYSPSHFEKWDFRNPEKQGIGGSETAHIEMAVRLAKRGHTIVSYSPLPKDTPKIWKDVRWKDLKEANFDDRGIWVIYRSPQIFDKFKVKHPHQQIWLVMQDTQYPQLTLKRALKCDKFFALCTTHVTVTKNNHPEIADRVILSANGIKTDMIRKLKPQVRDPYRIMYASSPDRGLINLLHIFPKIKERISMANLHIFYGFDNISKLADKNTSIDEFGTTINELEHLMAQDGVFWHGRVGQRKLYQEWLKSSIWAYPTRFSETSCITSMEAQALGAIPVTNPFWALKDNIMYGSLIDGDPSLDKLTRLRYVEEIYFWLSKGMREKQRNDMMSEVQQKFNWEEVVDQYEKIQN